ncbi:hypothetical protein BKA66DRAFT_242043 [Pyrenochaeta sp. MPI-SDFR-AT-0127]|nr:hypothetical protein BKA66DRAFT_242043 [Pyrenochaeta sp. MPI-SDFR-AT-0127]
MKFIVQLFTTAALISTAFAVPTAAESNSIEVRDAETDAVIQGMFIDKRQVCYCYGGTCTPGCYGKKEKRQVCYCYGGVCTPGCH